ncbi:hypothetical protein SLE2022_342160 [Rubroshorea leprosula]
MGDLQDWSPELNGVVSEERLSSSSSSSSFSSSSSLFSSNQTGNCGEIWQKAEEATQEIIALVQPTVVSEKRRKEVIDYVQSLVKKYLHCKVFPFGSVPLKTYLPDGDIDLTAFGGPNAEEALATGLCSVLEFEEKNNAAEFVVKDVQLIWAEVKLVKCLVQNIVVDISFNQLGGLCTLCFLERVDHLIGKDHLFKRSIILIKAWCYYESRILGAHHGLISTYALETLVLYIFNVFHSSLNGPLAVLYKFLEYFSKFDWDNYSISLNGPIHISSSPKVVVETPENGGADHLLSNDFLKDCLEMFSVPSRGVENNLRTFPQKHLNIVDPLKENNNLGRSVSKGNFYRIRSAFIYGARKLQHILSQAEENIGSELHKFFQNTLERHGCGQRPDVQDSVHGGLAAILPISGPQLCQEDQMGYEPEASNSSSMSGNCRSDHEDSLHRIDNVDQPGRETSYSKTLNEPQNSANGSAVSESRLSGDAEDLATSRIQSLVISNDASISSSPNAEGGISLLALGQEAGVSGLGNDEAGNKSIVNQQAFSPGRSRQHPSFVNYSWSTVDLYPSYSGYLSSTGTHGNHEASNSLSNLSGDYESHHNSLRYGRRLYDSILSAPVSPVSSPMLLKSKNSWDVVVRPSMPFKQNLIPPMNANGVPRPVFLPMNSPLLYGAVFGMEDMPKHRGIGTYFPSMNHYREKSLPARGRNYVPVKSRNNNGRSMTFRETNSPERSSHELSQVYSNAHQGGGRTGASDRHQSLSAGKFYPNANCSVHDPDSVVELESLGQVPPAPPVPGSPHAPNSSTVCSTPGAQMPDRITMQSYHLKDEEDFPPLSV